MFCLCPLHGKEIRNITFSCGEKNVFNVGTKQATGIVKHVSEVLKFSNVMSPAGRVARLPLFSKIIVVLEIQQNEAWLPNELHRSTLKLVISKCYGADFYENISLRCEYDHQVCMITYNVCSFPSH